MADEIIWNGQPQQAPAPTIADWISEGHGRIRKGMADHVFYGNLIDGLMSEIVKRDQIIAELKKPKAANERPQK